MKSDSPLSLSISSEQLISWTDEQSLPPHPSLHLHDHMSDDESVECLPLMQSPLLLHWLGQPSEMIIKINWCHDILGYD